MKKPNLFDRFIYWLFKKIFGTREISKQEMCKNAQDVCGCKCATCAWHIKEE